MLKLPAFVGLILAVSAAAQPTTLPATSPATAPATARASRLSADRFEDKEAGIAFSPPSGAVQQKADRAAVEQVATYVDQKKKTTLQVTRLIPMKPTPLIPIDDPKTPNIDESKQPGMLDIYVTQLSAPPLSARILRQEGLTAGMSGQIPVGMLAARFTTGPQRFLKQQALVQAGNKLEPFYFLIDFTTPSGKENVDDDQGVDPQEKDAVETFRELVDSVELLDLRAINRDIAERLFRTRTLYVNMTKARIASALIPQQCYLVLKDGHEIGYSFITEEMGARDGQDGPVISMRSASNADNVKTTAAAEYFSTPDRLYETWATVLNAENKDQKDQIREVGIGIHSKERVLDADFGIHDAKDPKQPPVRIVEKQTLTVTQFTARGNRPPVERNVGVSYLPQALSHLLPRLVPLGEPKTYCVSVWVGGGTGEVMYRFIDVEAQRKVTLRGRTFAAVPVKDRVGFSGLPTFHYFSLEGKYLGSVNESTHTAVVLSDEAEVRRFFADADLTAPQVLKRGK